MNHGELDLHVFGNVCLANKQWLAHALTNPLKPLLSKSLLLPLPHQCLTQHGQYTHPAFVGQEC